MRPIILVNFKTYIQGTGDNALKLAKIIDNISNDYDVEFIIAVQATDLKEISKNVSIKVFVENIEDEQQGQGTGHVIAESVKDAGAVGTLINHTEYQVELNKIEILVKKAKSLNLIKFHIKLVT